MKKVLFIFAALLTLGLVSCNKEVTRDSDEVSATFRFQIPDGIAAKAVSDGLTAKQLWVGVYDITSGTPQYLNAISLTDGSITFANLKATYTTRLVKGQSYKIVFWAQAPDTEFYTVNFSAATITVKYTGNANVEERDAFYKLYETGKVTGPIEEDIVLTRPLAQINVLAADYEAAQAAGITYEKASMTVYSAPNVLEVLTGEATGSNNYTLEATPALESSPAWNSNYADYQWAEMNYILATSTKNLYRVDFNVYKVGNTEPISHSIENVPMQRNYRTNIMGNLYTEQAEFNIVIDPIYTLPDYEAPLE